MRYFVILDQVSVYSAVKRFSVNDKLLKQADLCYPVKDLSKRPFNFPYPDRVTAIPDLSLILLILSKTTMQRFGFTAIIF